MNVVFVDKFC